SPTCIFQPSSCAECHDEPSDARKSPVGRDFESKFHGGDCVIASVRRLNMSFSVRHLAIACLLSTSATGRIGQVARPVPATGPALQSTINLRACEVPTIVGGGRCGSYDVYENRSTRTGRRIGLNVLVIPALGTNPAPDPVFWLEGGPGGAATQAAGPVTQNYFGGLRQDHDLVFVDARGTGQSNPLRCDDIGESPSNLDRYFGALFPVALIRECKEKLEEVADLTQYTTSIVVDDLDDVRNALGYPQVNLAGASYGTLTALAYMRQHPDRVRSAFLIGVVSPDFRLPLPFARAAQNALTRLLDACAAESACHSAFPNLSQEFDAVLARFERGTLTVTMRDPVTSQPRPVALERESYVEHLRALLYSTMGARFVPLVVHRAFLDDFVPFQTLAVRYNLGGPSTARGAYFSMTCAEAAPFVSEAEIEAQTRDTFLGDRRLRAHLAACSDWPKGDVPRTFIEPVRSTIPVVMFSGDADGSTPPWIAADAVRYLPNGRQIVAPRTGHQIDGPCTWDLMQAFVRAPSPQSLNASCIGRAQRPPFVFELPQ
ncbi:MAG: alpha/beta hydrolase, partial [Sphaerospermopsis kisseleviana]